MPSSSMPPKHPAAENQPLNHTVAMRTPVHPPWYYRLVISLLKPLYRLQVWQRSHKRDNYQQEVAQRFGKHYPPRPMADARLQNIQTINSQVNSPQVNSANVDIKNQVIWCHAVSLGETNTIAPLLDALIAKGYQVWLTNTTQTGYARGAGRFADEIEQGFMSHSYVPVDSPAVIKTFLAHVQPIAALFVETELWANILTELSTQRIPSILVNGRLSAASFTRYQKIAAVSASMMQNLTLIIAQDEDSAKRFEQLGASPAQLHTAGSLKWVINTPKPTHQIHARANDTATELESSQPTKPDLTHLNRPLWIAASTHSGEERTALAWHQQLLTVPELKNTLLIIVPRHPERFDEVADLIKQAGLQMARRSTNDAISAQTQVYLADTMGELMHWYAQADVALVGGSLVDIGGHNPVEPASVATPVIMGQYTQSCQSVVDQLASVGALYQPNNNFYQALNMEQNIKSIENSKDLQNEQLTSDSPVIEDTALIYQQLQFWLSEPELAQQAGQAGEQMTVQQQNVLSRQLALIEDVVGKAIK